MKKIKNNEKGFTLIEVIVTLILVGITAALAGMWIVSVANGYIFAKTNASTVQKAQLAMTRLTQEFTNLQLHSITASSSTGITFNRANSASVSVPVIISMSGTQLQINVNSTGARTLTDSVSEFELTYCDSPNSTSCPTTWSATSRIIAIKLKLSAGNNTPVEFIRRVTPRNT